MAESFLHDLRVVINFAGTRGAEKLQADDFEHEKLLDPDYERPLSIYESTVYTDFKPKDYPVEWKNEDAGLEVGDDSQDHLIKAEDRLTVAMARQ